MWNFEQTQTGLFQPYLCQWLKLKQESSGYPSWATTEVQKSQYIADYKRHEGIELDPAETRKNAGGKATAKLMLNSFWGKFGENLNKPQVISVTTPADLFAVFQDNQNPIESIRICNDNLLELVVRQNSDNQLDNGKRNTFIAAFTTCHARLKLYSYLESLKERVLYFDTDSVVYTWKPGKEQIPLGD